MAISLDVSDIKPLLGTFGLGQAPSAKLPDLQNMPVPPLQPPPPPPPTPAQAGFDAYSQDPANIAKVMNSLTAPGQSIIPDSIAAPTVPSGILPTNIPSSVAAPYLPAQASSAVRPPSAPAPLAAVTPPGGVSAATAPTPTAAARLAGTIDSLGPQGDTSEAAVPTLAQWEASNPGSVENHLGKGQRIFQAIAAGLVGAAGGIKGNPLAGANYAQGIIAQDQGVDARNQARYQGAVVQPLMDAAKLADTQSQTAQRTAAANKQDALSDSITPFVMTKEQAEAINQPALAGTQTTGRDYTKLLQSAGNNNTTLTKADKDAASKEQIAADRNQRMKDIADSANKTRTLLQQMKDVTSRANTDNRIASKQAGPNGGFKVPADVTKRAALASNVNENIQGANAIIDKRPDIFGAVGGRYTNVQQMIGSDDPDIHEMGVRMHNVALASNGAHGVRAQGAIAKTEDELFNNFKSGPNGIRGSFKATGDSMQTFLNDEKNFQTTGTRTGITPGSSDGSISGGTIPAAAAAQLQEGQQHTFGNGQVWTKVNGVPKRVK
jgi:hypothetical protein